MNWGLPRVGRARCFCGEMFWRPLNAGYRTCLNCQGQRRLIAAGFRWDDPALVALAAWNAAAMRRAGTAGERAA